MPVELPKDWDSQRNLREFLKWLGILEQLIKSTPADWQVWAQSRDAQDILSALARKLGFEHGPIEHRTERFMVAAEAGEEEHHRVYRMLFDPAGNLVAERFSSQIGTWRGPTWLSKRTEGGVAEPEFRSLALATLPRWREASEVGA